MPFTVDGIAAGDTTYGHRFLAPAASRCAASTITSRSSRRQRWCSIRRGASEIILTDAKNLAFAQGYELVEDEALLTRSPGWSNGRSC